MRPERPNHVWAYDFVSCRTEDGRAVRLLTVIDEYTRECMAIKAARRIRSDDVMHTLTGLFTSNGVPEHIRSDYVLIAESRAFVGKTHPWGELQSVRSL